MSIIKAVCFDAGGVFLRELWPRSVWEAEARDAAKIFDISLQRARKFFASEIVADLDRGKISELNFWKKFANENKRKMPDEEILKTILRKRKIAQKKSLLKIMKRLLEAGVKVGILTDVIPPHKEIYLRDKVFAGLSPVVMSCDEGIKKKDGPEIFEIWLRLAKAKPEETIFFDDVRKNVEIAKLLGIKAFIYKGPKQVVVILRRCGLI